MDSVKGQLFIKLFECVFHAKPLIDVDPQLGADVAEVVTATSNFSNEVDNLFDDLLADTDVQGAPTRGPVVDAAAAAVEDEDAEAQAAQAAQTAQVAQAARVEEGVPPVQVYTDVDWAELDALGAELDALSVGSSSDEDVAGGEEGMGTRQSSQASVSSQGSQDLAEGEVAPEDALAAMLNVAEE